MKKPRLNIDPKYASYLRPALGVLFFIIGAASLVIPFIPLGYILLAASLFLLAPEIPFLKRIIRKLKRKDNKNRINKVEEKITRTEKKVKTKMKNNNEKAQKKQHVSS